MRKGKLVAPVVVTVFLVLWLLGWIVTLFCVPELPLWGKLLGSAVSLALVGVSIFVLVERIKEIRSGEEDDLSQY